MRDSGLLRMTLVAHISQDASHFSTISGTHPRAPISLTKDYNVEHQILRREHKRVARMKGRSEKTRAI